MFVRSFRQKYHSQLETLFVFVLAAAVRLTSLNVFRAVDEEDRWAWAVDFYRALLAGDLPATLVGDGYPGIFPVWLETIWLFLASLYRSVLQGGWIGNDGVYLLIHNWDHYRFLGVQRFPVVFINTLLVVIIFLYLRHLFGRQIALVSAILISLDPFYLSDSRVNRAEGLLTGLMMISLLALIAAHRQPTDNKNRVSFFNWRHLLLSAIFGGLAWLTKSQSIVLIPMFTVIIFIWHFRVESHLSVALRRWILILLVWSLGATATFILLWPATWSIPGDTFSLMFNYATRKVGAEGVKLFFLGQTILDEDPGWLFYPVIFILRATPLMLLGLLLGGWRLIQRQSNLKPSISTWRTWLDDGGVWVLLAYALLYAGGMSLGSHKQDRFLMAVFPVLNVLAAFGFIGWVRARKWSIRRVWVGMVVILALQLATALPFHPYYFSYFNPLVGGGPVATRLTRIGWGEGMDQVATYLQSQDNPDSLVVGTRFTHYLLGFTGKTLPMDSDFSWIRADKIVLYIQQSQRMLEPSPGIIRYFQQHILPEKVITIDRIDYAHIYPNPIQYPAEPLADTIDNELRLLGYRWYEETDDTVTLHLIWENLKGDASPAGVRLWRTKEVHSDWLPCTTSSEFEAKSHTYRAIVESACPLSPANLSSGLYNLQIGVQPPNSSWLPLDFATGWLAIALTADGALQRVPPETVFTHLANEGVPASATWLEHTYFDQVRLLAYEVKPEHPQPGQFIEVELYWQALQVINQDAVVSLQAFVGDNQQVAMVNTPPGGGHSPTSSWHPGEVIYDIHSLEIPADTPTPSLLRLDVGLFLPDTLRPLPVRNLSGEDIPAAIVQVRLEPKTWPSYQGENAVSFTFGDSVRLIGYKANPIATDNTLEVVLYWKSLAPVDESYTIFLHVLNSEGTLITQSDVLPAGGFFPTSAWEPGNVVQSWHRLTLPPDLPVDDYLMLAGMYRLADGGRLPVIDANYDSLPDNVARIGQITQQ